MALLDFLKPKRRKAGDIPETISAARGLPRTRPLSLRERDLEAKRRLQRKSAPGQPLPTALTEFRPAAEAARLRFIEEGMKKQGGITPGEEIRGLRAIEGGITPQRGPIASPGAVSGPTGGPKPGGATPGPVTFAPATTDDLGRPLPKAGEVGVAGEMAPSAPTPESAKGTQVGGRILTPDQLAALSPEDRAREDAQFKIRNYATQKGLGFDQAARELGLEKFAGDLLSKDLGALTPEQIEARALEENKTLFERSQRDIQKKFEEQEKDLQDVTNEQKALARFRLARSGGLYSSSAGGLQEGGAIDIHGPDTILRKIQDEHDRTLQQLNSSRDRALVLARDAFDAGRFDIARQFMKDAEDSAINTAEQNSRYQDQINKTLSNASKIRDLAVQDIQTLVEGGQDDVFNDPDFIRQWSEQTGMSEDVTRGLVSIGRNEVAARQVINEEESRNLEINNAKTIVDLLGKVPTGQKISVGGKTYQGWNGGEMGTETDQFGNVVHWNFDPVSQKVTTTNLGSIGKAADGWSLIDTDQGKYYYNTKTKSFAPAEPSISQSAVQQLFPEGSRNNPFRPEKGAAGIQCGELMNDVNDPSVGRIWGDSVEQKLSVARDSQWSVPISDVQEGDTIVQSGGWTGHVLRVLRRDALPNGRVQIAAFEANMAPPGGGTVTSTRTLYLDDPKNLAAARVPTRPGLLGGTDLPGAAPGGIPTIGGVPIMEAFAARERPTKTQVIDTEGRRKLIDSITGETIRDLGSIPVAGKTPSAPQFQAGTFAQRIEQSIGIFDNLEEQIMSLSPAGFAIERRKPSLLKSPLLRQQEQAERNFVNAVLRRESGAAIAESEFESARKQYFPQPGDDAGTLEQKRRNRDIVLGGLVREAGSAYTPLGGQPVAFGAPDIESIPVGGTWSDPMTGEEIIITD